MELNKIINTKYGDINVTCYLDNDTWVISTPNNHIIGVVIQEKDYNKAIDKFIKLYSLTYKYHLELENNPYKGIVSNDIKNELFDNKIRKIRQN